MTEFSTESKLSLTVPESELRNVRQQIESGVGTTEVGVTDGGTMSAQASRGPGGGGRARRRARRSYRMEISRTEYLEQAVVYLEEIEDKVGTGGGGGGILDDVVGALVETGGDAALSISDAAMDAFTDTVGTALGNVIADAVSNSDLSVEKPDWVPIPVEEPGGRGISIDTEVDLPEFTLSPDLTVNPEFHPTFNPEFHPEISVSPEFNPTFNAEFNPEFSPEFQNEFSPEFQPDITVSPEISLPGVTFGDQSGQGGQPGPGRGRRPSPESGSGSGDNGALFSVGGKSGFQIGEGWMSFGGENGIVLGDRSQQNGQTGSGATGSQPWGDVSVSAETTSRVTVDPSGLRDLRDDILAEFDSAVEDTRSDLERQISDLEAEIDDLRSQVTGR